MERLETEERLAKGDGRARFFVGDAVGRVRGCLDALPLPLLPFPLLLLLLLLPLFPLLREAKPATVCRYLDVRQDQNVHRM